jgi:hypothetical protein
MNQQEPKQENLGKLLERHWEHCQHIENERSQFMQVYAAIAAGIIVGFTYLISVKGVTVPGYLIFGTWLFFLILTFLGFFLTLRWSQTFEFHRKIVNEIETRMSPAEGLDLSMEIPSMRVIWFKRYLKTRYLFPFFYLLIYILLCLANVIYNIVQAESSWLILSWFAIDILLVGFALVVFKGGLNSLAEYDSVRTVVLIGCNGEWAQKRYLPQLLKKASRGKCVLWGIDTKNDITLPLENILKRWQRAENRGQAHYLKITSEAGIGSIPPADCVFIVTPDRTHCQIAIQWLE